MKLKLIILLTHLAITISSAAQVVVKTPEQVVPEYMQEESDCDALDGALGTRDWDGDSVGNCKDNCLFDRNKNQKDTNKNGVGDVCEWRRRAQEEWDLIGRHQWESATEPADLRRLARRSSNILVVRFIEGGVPEDNFSLSRHSQFEIVRQLKGEARRIPASIYRGIWVWIPDIGRPRGTSSKSDLLLFLTNGKLRRWKEPHVFTANPERGTPYVETHYFGYQLADTKYGLLGVSELRLKQLEQIIQRERRK